MPLLRPTLSSLDGALLTNSSTITSCGSSSSSKNNNSNSTNSNRSSDANDSSRNSFHRVAFNARIPPIHRLRVAASSLTLVTAVVQIANLPKRKS